MLKKLLHFSGRSQSTDSRSRQARVIACLKIFPNRAGCCLDIMIAEWDFYQTDERFSDALAMPVAGHPASLTLDFDPSSRAEIQDVRVLRAHHPVERSGPLTSSALEDPKPQQNRGL